MQNVGKKTEEMLKLVPGTTVNTVERCSGHAGTYGVKKEHHKTANENWQTSVPRDDAERPKYISSDCQLSGHHIEQGIREGQFGDAKPELAHITISLRSPEIFVGAAFRGFRSAKSTLAKLRKSNWIMAAP